MLGSRTCMFGFWKKGHQWHLTLYAHLVEHAVYNVLIWNFTSLFHHQFQYSYYFIQKHERWCDSDVTWVTLPQWRQIFGMVLYCRSRCLDCLQWHHGLVYGRVTFCTVGYLEDPVWCTGMESKNSVLLPITIASSHLLLVNLGNHECEFPRFTLHCMSPKMRSLYFSVEGSTSTEILWGKQESFRWIHLGLFRPSIAVDWLTFVYRKGQQRFVILV